VFQQELQNFAESIAKSMRELETKMLAAFCGYAMVNAAVIQGAAFAESANAGRIEALESRVLELETRRGY
jgi:hypothetical protein